MLLSLQMRKYIAKRLACGLNSFSIIQANYNGINSVTFKCLVDSEHKMKEVKIIVK